MHNSFLIVKILQYSNSPYNTNNSRLIYFIKGDLCLSLILYIKLTQIGNAK